jgi:hypothetical protein
MQDRIDGLSPIFRWVASTFSDVSDFSFDVEAADVSGDLAYTVGYERFNGSVDGRPAKPMTVRVTLSTAARTASRAGRRPSARTAKPGTSGDASQRERVRRPSRPRRFACS